MNGHDRGIASIEELVATTLSRTSSEGRVLLGIAGTPGSGKSTLAAFLSRRLGLAPIVEMDGFHLSNAELMRAGLLHRKGAIETFDGHGFLGLVQRLRFQREGDSIMAPSFDRSLDACVADAVRIDPSDRIVIIEGNYLLSTVAPWASIRPNLDLCAYLDVDPDTRQQRLLRRHVFNGRTRAEAARFVRDNDECNAAMIEETRQHADLFLEVGSEIAVPSAGDGANRMLFDSALLEQRERWRREGSRHDGTDND